MLGNLENSIALIPPSFLPKTRGESKNSEKSGYLPLFGEEKSDDSLTKSG